MTSNKQQATSNKQQATSNKQQATSNKQAVINHGKLVNEKLKILCAALALLCSGDIVFAATASSNTSVSTNLSDQLKKAVISNNTKTIKSLIKQGVDIDNQDNDKKYTPLMYAAEANAADAISTLLSNKANPDALDKDGKTALIIAVESGNLKAVKKLADTNMLKANIRLIKKFKKAIDKKNESNLDIEDNKGYTALMYAVEKGRKDIFKTLLNEAADVNKKNHEGKTALMIAVEKENLDCIKLLIEKIKKFMQLFRTQSIKNDSVARAQQELNTVANPNIQDNNGKTALMIAVEKGNLKIVKELMGFSILQKMFNLSIDAKVDIQDNSGWTALMMAVKQGRKDIAKLLLDRKYWILSKKKKTDIKNKEGQTALMIAVSKGYSDLVDLLIKKGANVNAKDNNDKTPLMFAASSGNIKIVQALLKKKADINAKDKDGKTALYYAKKAKHTEITNLLTKNGAK